MREVVGVLVDLDDGRAGGEEGEGGEVEEGVGALALVFGLGGGCWFYGNYGLVVVLFCFVLFRGKGVFFAYGG